MERQAHRLHLQPQYLEAIETEKKTYEVRCKEDKYANIRQGDSIQFYTDSGKQLICIVEEVLEFASFRQTLEAVGWRHAVPVEGVTNLDQAIQLYHQIPGYIQKESLNVLAFLVKVVKVVPPFKNHLGESQFIQKY